MLGKYRTSFACFQGAVLGGVMAALLTGCATAPQLPTSEARITAKVDAMIIPPPGGPAIVHVVSTTFPNAIRQDISLATRARTAGENKISVIMFAGKGGDGSDASLRDVPFTQINLTQEASAAWPGAGMAVSPYYVQNAYGPFGYAIGKPANGDGCIYAWQRIAPTLKPSGGVARGTIVVRLQWCERGASEQQLLDIMYKLQFDGSVFPPGRAPARIGALAAPIRPVGVEGFAEVIRTAPAAPVPTPAPSQPAAPVAATAVAVTAPPVGTPIVPLPGGASGQTGPTVPRPPASTVIVPTPPGSSSQ
jgi:hypothetical protein